MDNTRKYFVTHIIVPNLPDEGYDQVFYYSATDESYYLGKYYWGKGNNSFGQDFINDLIRKEKIFRLVSKSYPLELKNDETLWVDFKGNLYIADLRDPCKNQRELETQELLRRKVVEREYGKSVANIILPEVSKETRIYH
jgi:hypothetical protein